MSIIKIGPKVKFTTLSNQLINDTTLYAEELGVMAYLLSKPEDWVVRVSQLAARFNMGKDRAYRILNDLIRQGWIQKSENRTEGGKFASVEYIVLSEKPDTVKPDTVQPVPVKPDPTKEREEQKTEKNKPTVPSLRSATPPVSKKPVYPTDYERLWSAFPKHPNASKAEGYKLWMRLDDDDREACLRGASCYASFLAAERTKRPDYPGLHLATFISQRRWEAHLEASKPNGQADPEAERNFLREWQLKTYGQTNIQEDTNGRR